MIKNSIAICVKHNKIANFYRYSNSIEQFDLEFNKLKSIEELGLVEKNIASLLKIN
jgi:hypothetical protein